MEIGRTFPTCTIHQIFVKVCMGSGGKVKSQLRRSFSHGLVNSSNHHIRLDHPLNVLHNFAGYVNKPFRFEDFRSGLAHNITWTSRVIVDGIVYGEASHARVRDARSEAARRAVVQLKQQYSAAT